MEGWSNKSVLQFAEGTDPVEAVVRRAREVVLKAMDAGWIGPPFDPVSLAELLGLEVVPSDDVYDARTLSPASGATLIEYNPNRPRGRIKYSVAHEIAHTFFPDYRERVRSRARPSEITGDEGQLETLCNLAAAEILMPVGSLLPFDGAQLQIDELIGLRKTYDVSMEALLVRAVSASDVQSAMFCASMIEGGGREGRYRVDYCRGHPEFVSTIRRGTVLPEGSVVAGCRAIGYTAKGNESWSDAAIPLRVECVAVPPYPGRLHPRVVGILLALSETSSDQPPILYLRGDATDPRGNSRKLIVHVVNDATANWGGAFARAVRERWPEAQGAFQEWAEASPGALSLGSTHVAFVSPDVGVASMVAQEGYGPSKRPRIRYTALQQALGKTTRVALEGGFTAHMPRIGCGEARGSWGVVEELLRETLVAAGVPVFVYDLPFKEPPKDSQLRLTFPMEKS